MARLAGLRHQAMDTPHPPTPPPGAALRMERDTLGEVAVPGVHLWGAQTQRALQHFAIGSDGMPRELLLAMAHVKRAAATVNAQLGLLPPDLARAIVQASDEVLAGRWDTEFPLPVWQSGSGTQSHMNMNEVLANRASQLLGGPVGADRLVHPNDHVNRGQSSNDVVPTAMHLACLLALRRQLLPALQGLQGTLEAKSRAFAGIVKIGRTHLQDATPLTLGQEVSAWAAQLAQAQAAVACTLPALRELAIGGTAVGTGMNTHPQFGARVAALLAQVTGEHLATAANPFAALAAHDALVQAHGALKGLATALLKIANDLRWLASGPRCGLGELRLPANEPGSSIMPGKVNPTQCEALVMVCCQVLGNDVAMGMANAAGQFQLNTCKPLLAHAMLHSVRLLGDAMRSLDMHCARGIKPDEGRIALLLQRSLMLVTALAPHIGHDQAAAIARHAHAQGLGLREAALASGLVSDEQFDAWVRPQDMV